MDANPAVLSNTVFPFHRVGGALAWKRKRSAETFLLLYVPLE